MRFLITVGLAFAAFTDIAIGIAFALSFWNEKKTTIAFCITVICTMIVNIYGLYEMYLRVTG